MPKEWAGRPVYTVSELVRLLASELEGAFPDVWVEGEIANWKRAPSGHCYLTLKDERGALKTVMWRASAQRLGFEPDNGMVVLARGKLSVYEASGDLQLYATVLEPAGLGALQMAFEQAKRRLAAEGLTDPDRRRPIPPFPRRVGVVTSIEGAALRDVLSVLRRRRAGFGLVVSPALVQGTAAPASLSAALKKLQRVAGVEVILLTRGGGSMQDLWAFNDEALARLVAECSVPVISAVGHEVDTVLTDLTADLRAPTPSVAAEFLTAQTEAARTAAEEAARRIGHAVRGLLFAVQERTDRCRASRMSDLIARRLGMAQEGADRAAEAAVHAMSLRLGADAHRLDLCRRSLTPEAFLRWLDGLSERRRSSDARLRMAVRSNLGAAEGRFSALVRVLHSLSPLSALSRGFAAAFDDSGKPVTRTDQAVVGALLSLALFDGGLDCTVISKVPSHLPPTFCRALMEGPRPRNESGRSARVPSARDGEE
jgi:exodeoxyribonuclease VII large subunit